jgi:hypothetical protein
LTALNKGDDPAPSVKESFSYSVPRLARNTSIPGPWEPRVGEEDEPLSRSILCWCESRKRSAADTNPFSKRESAAEKDTRCSIGCALGILKDERAKEEAEAEEEEEEEEEEDEEEEPPGRRPGTAALAP